MPETLKASWHMLPEPVKQQAAARWPSIDPAGPGDGYIYTYELVVPHQLDIFEVRGTYEHFRPRPHLIGRHIDKDSWPIVSKAFVWSRPRP